jgi:hypothetical protein
MAYELDHTLALTSTQPFSWGVTPKVRKKRGSEDVV